VGLKLPSETLFYSITPLAQSTWPTATFSPVSTIAPPNLRERGDGAASLVFVSDAPKGTFQSDWRLAPGHIQVG
jgi:hypothetical protein